jgi:hypothetical protein
MAALGGGIAALVLGIIGIILWWEEFLQLLMGGVPIILIMGGALAAYLGFEEIKDKKSSETFSTSESEEDLKQEVENLKQELKELKGEKEETKEESDS